MIVMRLNHFATLFIGLILTSCNQNASLNSTNQIVGSAKANVVPVVQDSLKNAIDLNNYAGLPFWTVDMPHASGKGYIDTFTIGESKLRIVHQNDKFDGIVEVNRNDKWYKVWQFENLGNQNDYDRTHDLNRDGYNDLIFQRKWSGDVHFFDVEKEYFSPEVNCVIGEDWHELDSIAGLFYEVNAYNMTRPVTSTLFLIKKKARVDLASLTLTFDSNDENYAVKKAVLHLLNNDTTEEIKVPQNVTVDDFDYEAFWKERQKNISSEFK